MYKCEICYKKYFLLREATYHTKRCSNRYNYMVFSRFRVPAYKQCKRDRGDPYQLKNILQISKL